MSDDDRQQLGQDEVERLLAQHRASQTAKGTGSAPTPAAPQAGGAPPGNPAPQKQETAANIVSQDAINQLLSKQGPGKPAAAAKNPRSQTAEGDISQGDIELLLRQAEDALASIDQPEGSLPPNAKPFSLQSFVGTPANTELATLELLSDVELDVTIEFGRTHMHLEDVLKLRKGSVVPLDKLAGDPVEIIVNGRLVARGEILVLNDNFCVRVAELITGDNLAA